jgi:plasmodium exported protein (PHISTb)
MKFVYDIDRIYKNLIDKYNKKMDEKSIDEDIEKEQEEVVKSPEDAPETQEVAEPTSMESEDVHGGNESAKEIKDSPNPAENFDSESEKNIDKEINEEKDSKEKDEKLKDTKKHNTLDELRKKKRKKKNEKRRKLKRKKKIEKEKLYYAEKELETKESDNEENEKDYKDEKSNNSSFQSSLKFDPNKNYDEIVKKIFDDNDEKLMSLKRENIGEYLKQKVIQIIKDISLKHAGIDKNDGVETFDKKEMMTHIFKYQNYKLLNDKYDLKDARYVQFFIDTSGVYNNSSNRLLNTLIPEVIKILEMQGYECNLAACGNGFYGKDMVEDEYYGTRKTLENYKAGHVSKIACPTAETAAKMANEAEFSIVLADFDGLSSISYMASLCQEDKVPYFLSTEDRYPWEKPSLHNWVDPYMCEYDMKKVYDVSANGNPSLEDYDVDYYDYDDDYDDGDYDDIDY